VPPAQTAAPTAAALSELIGTWTATTGSWAGYRVVIDVPFFGESEVTGRTQAITGTTEIQPGRGETVIQSAGYVGDLRQLTSGDTLLDNQVRRLLQIDAFPTAEFTITRPVPLPSDDQLRAGAIVPLPGQLSLLGQSREVIVPARFVYSGDRLTVTASIEFRLADFGIPNDQGLFSVADAAAFEFELQLVPGG
jgi:polyisoprenoid-binding protein YceI